MQSSPSEVFRRIGISCLRSSLSSRNTTVADTLSPHLNQCKETSGPGISGHFPGCAETSAGQQGCPVETRRFTDVKNQGGLLTVIPDEANSVTLALRVRRSYGRGRAWCQDAFEALDRRRGAVRLLLQHGSGQQFLVGRRAWPVGRAHCRVRLRFSIRLSGGLHNSSSSKSERSFSSGNVDRLYPGRSFCECQTPL